MSFETESKKPSSEKILLCTIESAINAKIFSLYSGSVYYRDVSYFVSSVKQDGSDLTKASSVSLSQGQYYYDETAGRVYVRMTDSSNPKTKDITIFFKHFYSSCGINAPHDLDSGFHVEWDSRIDKIGSINQQLDNEATGIVLESKSSITLLNGDGYFDEILDTHIWENKRVVIYQLFDNLPVSEAKIVFSGYVTSKDFDPDRVSFQLVDDIFRLRNLVNLPLFSTLDGDLSDSTIGTPKRRVYGRVKQMKCVGIDKSLNGYPMTGTITTNIESTTVIGLGTSFLDELSPGDEIRFTIDGEDYKITVETVTNNTSFEASNNPEINTSLQVCVIDSQVPWRKKNRQWHIAGHELMDVSESITEVLSSVRIRVSSVNDLFVGDSITVNSQTVKIRRISGDILILNQALSPLPNVSDLVLREPVSNVFFGNKELIINRDWTIQNTGESILVLDNAAEFNITGQKQLGVSVQFTNGSRSITTSATVDFRSILKPRDWIRKNSLTESSWYEILEVKEQEIIIRTSFTGTTQSTTALIKTPEYISDDSLITVNCFGYKNSGEWIRTSSDAVKHLIESDAGLSNIDTDSFNKANGGCGYIVSIVIPEDIESDAPLIRDVIGKINSSVFGSVYLNSDFDVSFNILNSTKPDDNEFYTDSDIIDFDVKSDQRIISDVSVYYRPFVDIESEEDAFELYEKSSEFVNRKVGISKKEEFTLYLYDEEAARIMGQRILFFRSLSDSVVSIKAKSIFATSTLNDKIYLNLDRLYKRYGQGDRKKIINITSIKKNGLDVDIEGSDFGNVFNRVPAIAPDTQAVYTSASEEEIAKWGFVVDNDTLTPNASSELSLGCNLIG